jgi:hypothetical protein
MMKDFGNSSSPLFQLSVEKLHWQCNARLWWSVVTNGGVESFVLTLKLVC